MKKINGAYVPTITVIERNLNPIFEEEEKYLGLNNPCDINFNITVPETCFGNGHDYCFSELFFELSGFTGANSWTFYGGNRGLSFSAYLALTNCCHEGQQGTKNGTLDINWGFFGATYKGKVNCKLNKGSKLKLDPKSRIPKHTPPWSGFWKSLTIYAIRRFA